MPVDPTYAGVYIEEIPSGVRTIMAVATSITAFVGRAKRGLTDKPVKINGFADYERLFGGLWLDSTTGSAVRDFFVNGDGEAIIVRLYNPVNGDGGDRSKRQLAVGALTLIAADAGK